MRRKVKRIRRISFIMTLMMFLTMSFIPASGENLKEKPNDINEEVYVVEEDFSKRGEFEKHFKLSNGLYRAYTYEEAVHYKDNGNWFEIDNTLKLNGEVYKNGFKGFELEFSKNSIAQDIVKLSNEKGQTVSWTLLDIPNAKTKGASSEAKVYNIQKESSVNVQEDKLIEKSITKNSSSILYENVYPNIDLQYINRGTKIKENYIIKAPSEKTEFRMLWKLGNLVPFLNSDGSVSICTPEGDEVYFFEAPFMYDSSLDGTAANGADVKVTLELTNEGYVYSLLPNLEWLNDSSRVYPIILDPTGYASHLGEPSKTWDTYTYSGDTNHNGKQNMEKMYVGKNYPYSSHIFQAYLKFNSMPILPASNTITSAIVYTRYVPNTTTFNAIQAYRVNSSYGEDLKWTGRPTTGSYIGNFDNYSGLNSRLNVTSLAQSWYYGSGKTTGTYNNYGIMMKYANESINDFNVFCTSEWNYGSSFEGAWPKLVIEYVYTDNTNPPAPTALQLNVGISKSFTGAGQVHDYTFPTKAGWLYMVDTTGSIDTVGTVIIAGQGHTDDNSGVSNNCAVGFKGDGSTAVIRIKQFSSSATSGTYSIKVRRQRVAAYTNDSLGQMTGIGWIHVPDVVNFRPVGDRLGFYANLLGYDFSLVHSAARQSNLSESHADNYTKANADIFFYGGHGSPGYLNFRNFNMLSVNLPVLTNTKIAFFASCSGGQSTAWDPAIGYEAVYNKGASSALVFNHETSYIGAVQFYNNLFPLLYNGYSISQAAAIVQKQFTFFHLSYTIYGNKHQTLNTARAGQTLLSSTLPNPELWQQYYNDLEIYDFETVEYQDGSVRHFKLLNGYKTNDYYEIDINNFISKSETTIPPEAFHIPMSVNSLDNSQNTWILIDGYEIDEDDEDIDLGEYGAGEVISYAAYKLIGNESIVYIYDDGNLTPVKISDVAYKYIYWYHSGRGGIWDESFLTYTTEVTNLLTGEPMEMDSLLL